MPVSSAPRPGSGMSSGEVPRESPDPTTTSRAPHPHRHRALEAPRWVSADAARESSERGRALSRMRRSVPSLAAGSVPVRVGKRAARESRYQSTCDCDTHPLPCPSIRTATVPDSPRAQVDLVAAADERGRSIFSSANDGGSGDDAGCQAPTAYTKFREITFLNLEMR